MQVTPYTHVNELLELILSSLQRILGTKLVGLYLYGSLVIGDFDPDISDIDLVVALSSEIDEKEFEALQKMHTDFAQQHREWDGRIEVCYISVAALKTVRSRTSTIANISPGEPFHRKESSREWLSDWHLVREKGVTLFGPSPKEVIEPISKDEFIQAIKAHARAWGEWIHDMHTWNGQTYAILTMCRALYTCTNGEQVSKKQAGIWAQQALPEWSQLIQNAIMWREGRRNEQVDDEATFAETKRFMDFVRDSIATNM
ncbi:MAG TPA: aminoglycoside adenylyltransferase domain-containing protein [Ktedonobacteraceae bacterium]|nr:aminoglycoside adenylyltransferase domain-containing protein [Ktedonobacteraceae bacterium]